MLAALPMACASRDKLFDVQGELVLKRQEPPIVVECGSDATYYLVMPIHVARELIERSDALAETSASPILVRLRGEVAMIELADALRQPFPPRFKLRVRQIDSLEHGSCERGGA